MNKNLFITLASAGILIIGLWYFFGNGSYTKKYPAPEGRGKNIIAFGDSLVEGVGASPGNNFVSLLSKKLGADIINAGFGGDTTASALDRLSQDVISRDPKIVVVLLGGNDAVRRIPKQETFKNLEKIIDRVQEKGAGVLLIGIQSGFFRDNYKKDFAALARKKGAWHVPDILDGIFAHPDLMDDAIHPNDKGYQIIANRLEPVLREMLTTYFGEFF